MESEKKKTKTKPPLPLRRLRTVEGVIKDTRVWKVFEHACHLQCEKVEIARLLELKCEDLERACWERYNQCFADVFAYYSEGGKMMLRRYQLDLAKKSASMAIWLGKQWLKQKDHPDDVAEFNGKLGELLDVLKGDNKEIEVKE